MALEGGDFEIAGEASSAAEAVEAAQRVAPDVCLLDVSLPGGGIEAAGRILTLVPTTEVVMLSGSPDERELFDALRAGARGYLPVDMNPDRLGPALRGVLAGEAAIPRALVGRMVDEFRARARRRRHPGLERLGVELTDREWDVLELMRERLDTGQIAERLAISPVTVRRHVSELLRKLGAASRRHALELLGDERVQD